MSYIQCVDGKINIEDIKKVDAHTHLYANATPSLIAKDPDLHLNSLRKVGVDIEDFKQLNGNLIVEMTTIDYGYDLDKLLTLAQQHNIHIVGCAGFNKGIYNKPLLENKDIDEVADQLIKELKEGVGQKNIKAGVLKIGTSLNIIEPWEEIGLRAVARASNACGIPISTHTQAGTMALEQLALFKEEKVPFENIVICHLDQLDDFNTHKKILEMGVFLSYDSIAKPKYATRERAISYICKFAESELYKQIVIGNDFARCSNFKGYNGKLGYDNVFNQFEKELYQGLKDYGYENSKCLEIREDIYSNNAKRAFAYRGN